MSPYRVVALCLVAACGGDASVAVDPVKELELSFAEPGATPDGILFTLVVRNPTGSTVEVPLHGTENSALDLEIRSEDGALVWRRHTGYVAAPAVTRLLAAGESFELEAGWDLRTSEGTPVQPGTYRVKAFLTADATSRREASPARSITVPPRSG